MGPFLCRSLLVLLLSAWTWSFSFTLGEVLTETFGSERKADVRIEEEEEEVEFTGKGPEDTTTSQNCLRALDEITKTGQDALFSDLKFALHRNGESDACGVIHSSFAALVEALEDMNGCEIKALNRYSIEGFLSSLFLNQLAEGECGSTDNATAPEGLVGYCDMGPERTVYQNDFKKIDQLPKSGSLPCRFFSREGFRIDSLSTLAAFALDAKEAVSSCGNSEDEDQEQVCSNGPTLHLYAVPAGRFFMFAPSHIGERFVLDHVPDAEGPIVAETLSLSPRVFELHDFFSLSEAEALIQEALSETSETHKLHRSTTGATNGQIYSKRTSDNAWVTHSTLALRIKKRCLDFLGFEGFWRSHTDGLQVLRYQNGQAYVPHLDYLTNSANENYDYDSSGVGGNRYATILLYMSDLGENDGGETVFEKAWPVGVTEEEKKRPLSDTIQKLRETGEIDMLKPGSWEEELAAKCRTRLAVKPKAGRAVLFYSQHPNGGEDKSSLHGACPVLGGTKWAANLWVWSAPKTEYPGAPRLRPEDSAGDSVSFAQEQKIATFRNTGVDPRFDKAELFWDGEVSFGPIGKNDPLIRVNTFPGHRWHVMVDGETLQEFVIADDDNDEAFEI